MSESDSMQDDSTSQVNLAGSLVANHGAESGIADGINNDDLMPETRETTPRIHDNGSTVPDSNELTTEKRCSSPKAADETGIRKDTQFTTDLPQPVAGLENGSSPPPGPRKSAPVMSESVPKAVMAASKELSTPKGNNSGRKDVSPPLPQNGTLDADIPGSELNVDLPSAFNWKYDDDVPATQDLSLQGDKTCTTTKIASSPRSMSPVSSGSRCTKCQKRKAAEGCHEAACLACCEDMTCVPHKRPREQALFRAQVLEASTDIQRRAADLRARKIPDKRRFVREPSLAYTGDTIVIWNVREYLANPKWRDDAVRKSLRRQERSESTQAKSRTGLGSSRKRFRAFLQQKLDESNMMTDT